MASEYTGEFFQALREGALRSAEEIVPIVLDLIQPGSVIDVGCGTGTWLATFARHGVDDYLGIDGFVPGNLLEIPYDRFIEADLKQPLALDRGFDLAISLEVAEHLPDSTAQTFIELLTSLAPAVLFSAAIPGQGGTSHLNERWPEYWYHLFVNNGFEPIDVMRPLIWDNERIDVWYAQNTILYLARNRRADFPRLQAAAAMSGAPLAAVHPRLFAERDFRVSEIARLHAEATAQAQSLQHALVAEQEKVRSLSDQIEKARCEAQHDQDPAKPTDGAETFPQRMERYSSHVQRLEAELNVRRTEADALRAELDHCRRVSEPGNMPLPAYLRAAPQVVGRALRRAVPKRQSGRRGP